jgi:hypothetical protein
MRFYDLSKEERQKLVVHINQNILSELKFGKNVLTLKYFSDDDTYIRKSGYLAIGKIYKSNPDLQTRIVSLLNQLFNQMHRMYDKLQLMLQVRSVLRILK